jgi:hypothetical protein
MDEVKLSTVSERLAKGSDQQRYKASNISPDKRAKIEEMLRRGVALFKIATDTASSTNTVTAVRDQLLEREPEMFRSHMATSLQRVANKTLGTIERGIDSMADGEVKPNQLAGLSVSLGILLDKHAGLTGHAPQVVVEHRLKVDSDTVARLVKSRDAIEVEGEVLDVTDSNTTG